MRIKYLLITAVLATAILSFTGFVKVQADTAVTATCSALGDLSQPGVSITWTATAGGGDGTNYTYNWSGTDGLSGTASTATQTYSTSGRKTANVTVTSNSVSKTVTCYATVGSYPAITATCSAARTDGATTPVYINDSVTWTATATGGNGTFTYSWSGTGTLSGADASTAPKTYSTKGKKTANVKITSNGVSKTAICNITVNENIQDEITCMGNAVNTREQALITAMTAYTASLNSAYSARATALRAAYAITTGLADVKSARKTAWNTFNSSKKAARITWRDARNAAWALYRTTAIACKAPSGTGDGIFSGFEAIGQ